MDFKKVLTTANVTPGINTKEYIIVHHTATKAGTIQGILNGLTKGTKSVHFVIDVNGDIYKIGIPDQILWHAGESQRGDKIGMNKYSIGIEIIGPTPVDGFYYAQKVALKELVRHLIDVYDINIDNILRHADITCESGKKNILWDGVSKARKVDVDKSFFFPKYACWRDYQYSIPFSPYNK